jgi:hypothetical protein
MTNPLTLIRVARNLLRTSYDFAQQGDSGRSEAICDLQEAQARITRAIDLLREEIGLPLRSPAEKEPTLNFALEDR